MMKCITLAFAALLGLSAPALAQRAAPTEIRSNGEIWLGNAAKIGKREGTGANAKTALTPDSIEAPSGGKIAGIPFVPNVLGTGTPGVNGKQFFTYSPSTRPTATEPTLRIDYRPTYTGGTGITVGAWSFTDLPAGITDSHYGLLTQITGRAENGPNTNWVAEFTRCDKATKNSSACWGGVMQTNEISGTADPTTNSTGLELNVRANGTDANNNRTLLSLALQPWTAIASGGAAPVAARAILIGPENGDPTHGSFDRAAQLIGKYNIAALDLSEATCTVACWQSNKAQILGTGRANFASVGIGTQQIFLYENNATTGQLGIRAGNASSTIFANFDPTNGFAVQGPVQGTLGTFTVQKLIPTVFGNLPACSSTGSGAGYSAVITDAAGTITYRGTASGGGTQHAKVFCDASNSRWIYN
jgi:hypothetical protein